MGVREIQDREELAEALRAGLFLLVKHSRRCPVSRRVFKEVEAFAAAHPEVPVGFLDVLRRREDSAWLARETGIRHESPQALLVRDGRVVWDASHRAVTRRALEAVLFDG